MFEWVVVFDEGAPLGFEGRPLLHFRDRTNPSPANLIHPDKGSFTPTNPWEDGWQGPRTLHLSLHETFQKTRKRQKVMLSTMKAYTPPGKNEGKEEEEEEEAVFMLASCKRVPENTQTQIFQRKHTHTHSHIHTAPACTLRMCLLNPNGWGLMSPEAKAPWFIVEKIPFYDCGQEGKPSLYT